MIQGEYLRPGVLQAPHFKNRLKVNFLQHLCSLLQAEA